MRFSKTKLLLLMLGLLFSTMVYGAYGHILSDGSNITIQTTHATGAPKTSYIQATLDGHNLYVVFLDDLGRVNVEVTYADGGNVDALSTLTPNGVNFYIFDAGSYVVTFTLENGDTYFGEFEVTD